MIYSGADITVVIPAHNSGQYIKVALESIEKQTIHPTKILVVENASTDDTNETVERHARTSAIPIQVISTPCPGVANARNLGFSLAETQLIAMLDSDDIYEPDFLALSLAAFNAIPDLGIFFGNRRPLIDDQIVEQPFLEFTALTSLPYSEKAPDIRLIEGDLFAALLHGSFISCSGAVLRKTAAYKAGLFPLHLSSSEDRDFFCRLALQGPAAYTLRMTHLYRIHANSRTGSSAALEAQKNALACLLTLRLELRNQDNPQRATALERAIIMTGKKVQYLAAEEGSASYQKTLHWLRRIGSPISKNPFYPLKAIKNSLKI